MISAVLFFFLPSADDDGNVVVGVLHGSFATWLASSYSRDISKGNSSLASQSIPTWNQIIAWLKEMETLLQTVA